MSEEQSPEERKGDSNPDMVRPELSQACPSCRTLNPAEVTACRACAQPLTAVGTPASRSEQRGANPTLLPLARWQEGPFVGRERELALLQAARHDSFPAHGRVLLLPGDPGMGKPRLVTELAADARQRGVRVLLGRCYEGEGAPPFWPWV